MGGDPSKPPTQHVARTVLDSWECGEVPGSFKTEAHSLFFRRNITSSLREAGAFWLNEPSAVGNMVF